MATIVGGLAASHTPSIAFAVDNRAPDDPVWAPIFEGFAPVRRWLEEKAPDVLFFVYNDHVTSFFFDHYSNFALGVGDTWPVADEGGGPRPLPALRGHAALADHIARGLVADEFDLSFFQSRGLDHGVFSPLSMMLPHEGGWPAALVPLQVGVLQFPIPTARRCFALGRSLRRAILSFPEDIRVAIVGSGGLSHQVSGERAGFNNSDWDMEFLDLLEKDPVKLTELSIADFAERGGVEGAEVIMWLVMRGALAPKVRKVHQSYCLPSMTATATVVYEDTVDGAGGNDGCHGGGDSGNGAGGNDSGHDGTGAGGNDDGHDGTGGNDGYRRKVGYDGDPGESPAAHLARSTREYGGLDRLDGSYPFTFDRSIRAYRLNKYLHGIIQPELRGRFLYDREGSYERGGLTEQEKDMLRRLDWRAMIRYGVIFFILEKLAAAVGVSNQEIYAAMRDESLEDFQKTRNTQVLYSVAGRHESR